jgi:hypothetical protein
MTKCRWITIRMRIISGKVIQKIRKFYIQNLFRENHAVHEIMWKNVVWSQTDHIWRYNVAHALCKSGKLRLQILTENMFYLFRYQGYSGYATPSEYSLYVLRGSGVYLVCLWCVSGVPLACLCCASGVSVVPVVCLWCVSGVSALCLWCVSGASLLYLWCVSVVPLVCLCCVPGVSL